MTAEYMFFIIAFQELLPVLYHYKIAGANVNFKNQPEK